MKEISVEASIENLNKVLDFVNNELRKINCPKKAESQIDIAIDELFSNIVRYAYTPNKGQVTIGFETLNEPLSVVITFIDNGVPYDPLTANEPDTTSNIDERVEGGLGIFMVKNSMDSFDYEYKDGKNILKIRKNI